MPDLPDIQIVSGKVPQSYRTRYAQVFEALKTLDNEQHIRLDYNDSNEARKAYNGLYQHATRKGIFDKITIRIVGSSVLIQNKQED